MKKGILFLLGMFSIFLFIPCAWTMNKPIDMTEEELQIDMTEEELQNAIKEKRIDKHNENFSRKKSG